MLIAPREYLKFQPAYFKYTLISISRIIIHPFTDLVNQVADIYLRAIQSKT